ncbi:lytic polysaccharide monooxygenase [Chitinimonas sp. PSY-7]|uniref:lytic polysaccharide monooxygenase n=1 Tax=Chitinimonas sp. PSY-7 TaxID=3459088 RepID=UPI0040402868
MHTQYQTLPAKLSTTLAVLAAPLLTTLVSTPVQAHGAMAIPVDRVYNCFQEGPESPKSAACKAARDVGGTQAFYDWNGVNQGNANDQHQAVVPDGKLCGAGKETYKGFNLARDDWPATNIAPNANGQFDFLYRATAPHSTRYFKFYVTRNGYNPSQPLKWSDLESQPFCTITNNPLVNGHYKMTCPFPQGKSGRQVIYSIWQRNDSPEAFYSCMDVNFSGVTTPTTWKEIGPVRAQQDLPVNSKVTFRLFAPDFKDLETHTITLASGMTGASQWPFHLAQKVNAASQYVKVGVLGNNGSINPVQSNMDNRVYERSNVTADYSFAIDINNGGGGSEGQVDFIYPAGIAGYKAGTIVQGSDGKRYQCKPYPYAGWCSQSPAHYAPATGSNWTDAWALLS